MKRKMIKFDLSNQQDKQIFDFVELKKNSLSEYVKQLIQADMSNNPKPELSIMQKSFIQFTKKVKGDSK